MVQLTKDADIILCSIYKQYLEQRKSGIPKQDAKYYDYDFYKSNLKLSSWHESDVSDTLSELRNVNYIRMYYDGGFLLADSAIIYMESRFKNGLKEVMDFISKLIP